MAATHYTAEKTVTTTSVPVCQGNPKPRWKISNKREDVTCRRCQVIAGPGPVEPTAETDLDTVKEIRVNQVEGRTDQMIRATVDSYDRANALLIAVAALNNGPGYYKVEVTVVLQDGSEIFTRHDVKPLGTDGNDLDVRRHAAALVKFMDAENG